MVNTTRSSESGIALVFTLFLMASLSALAVSLMFLAQTETSGTRNYRTMSQARYAGEAGVHKAINYMINTYTTPSSFSSYNLTVSPVTCSSGCTTNGGPIILSSLTGGTYPATNYPDATAAAAFTAAVQGTLATNISGTTSNGALGTVTYGVYAKLMAMRAVTPYGGGSGVVQTWEITAVGTVPGALPATVEVTAVLERNLVDAQTFAVFATGTGCGAITLGGNASTGSYDSSVSSTTTNSGGNFGSNGNMDISGSVAVYGSISSPRAGVGTCTTGGTVTALTESGHAATIPGDNLVSLPQPLNFTTPAAPDPMPPWANQNTCAQFNVTAPATCTPGSPIVIDPMGTTVSLGTVTANVLLKGGDYIINAFASVDITTGATANTGNTSTVKINLAGKTSTNTWMTSPWDMTSQTVSNPSMIASNLQILYAGTGKFDMHGGATTAMTLYAPNATAETHGNGSIYGSILVASLALGTGNTSFYYDRSLDRTAFTLGNYVMTSFSWKKY